MESTPVQEAQTSQVMGNKSTSVEALSSIPEDQMAQENVDSANLLEAIKLDLFSLKSEFLIELQMLEDPDDQRLRPNLILLLDLLKEQFDANAWVLDYWLEGLEAHSFSGEYSKEKVCNPKLKMLKVPKETKNLIIAEKEISVYKKQNIIVIRTTLTHLKDSRKDFGALLFELKAKGKVIRYVVERLDENNVHL